MQEQMNQARETLRNTLVEGSAGNGLVSVILTGEKELKKISIKPECTTDVEGLQDLIIAACQDAYAKLENQHE